MISRPGAVAARRYGGGVVLTNLPLARTAIDADGASRTRAGLLGELFAGESTAVVLVHRGLVGATAEGLVLLPAGQVPPEARTAEDVDYLGRDGDQRVVAEIRTASARKTAE